MLIDAFDVSTRSIVKTDICIIGAGPTGLALAQEFINSPLKICVLESGDFEADPQTRSLDQGKTSGDPYLKLDVVRSRQIGGTANQWCVELPPEPIIGVRYGQLDAVDFEPRDWLPYSGWCVTLEELTPFFRRAQQVCRLGPFDYGPEIWEDDENRQLPLVGDRLKTTMFQFGPRSVFIKELPQQVSSASNIDFYFHANAIALETDADGQTVQTVQVACLNGNRFKVKAKRFILAMGGIENARILLLSNQVQAHGLGNQWDQVGRYYMDHPLVFTGVFVPADRNLFNKTALYDKRRVKDTVVMAKLALTDEVIRAEQVMNMSFVLFPRYESYPQNGLQAFLFPPYSIYPQGLEALRELRSGQAGSVLKRVKLVLTDLPKIGKYLFQKLARKLRPPVPAEFAVGGWSDWSDKARKLRSFHVYSQTEQAPHPENRILLDRSLDALGCPQVRLQWQWRDLDIQHVQRAQLILQEELACAGLGQLHIQKSPGGKPVIFAPSSHHLMGATRMHSDPRQGVVDANCQVHGTTNLFIAGSSVFPTGGYANPTLTMVALGLRLADHLKEEFTAELA